MGHSFNQPKSIKTIENKSFMKRKNEFDSNYNINKFLVNSSGYDAPQGIIHKKVQSKKSSMVFDEESNDNNFINIPKVQINYNNTQTNKPSVVRNKFRKYKQAPKNNRQRFASPLQNTLPVKRGYLTPKNPVRKGGDWSNSSIPRIRKVSNSPMREMGWNSEIKGKVKIFDDNERSSSRFNEMDKEMQLGFDVFSKEDSLLSQTKRNSNSMSSTSDISQLSRKVMMNSEILLNVKKDNKDYMKSMFNIKNEMTSTRDNPVKSMHKLDFSKSKTNLTSSTNITRKSVLQETWENKVENILRSQKANISTLKLNEELNNYLKSSPVSYSENILELNAKLNLLKKKYLKHGQTDKNVAFLKKKLNNKNQQLVKKGLELEMLENKDGDLLTSEIKNFESSLDPSEQRKRKREIKKLRKLEGKLNKYQNQWDDLENRTNLQSEKMLGDKDVTIKNEIEELKMLLEDDHDDRFLIEKMEKMLRSHNLLE
jgi:hypothetical protein